MQNSDLYSNDKNNYPSAILWWGLQLESKLYANLPTF